MFAFSARVRPEVFARFKMAPTILVLGRPPAFETSIKGPWAWRLVPFPEKRTVIREGT